MANISKINFKGVEYDIKPLMDAVPTQGSNNAVSSGGVYDALQSAGLSEDVKTALLNCFKHVAWKDEHGDDYKNALRNALYDDTPYIGTLSFPLVGESAPIVGQYDYVAEKNDCRRIFPVEGISFNRAGGNVSQFEFKAGDILTLDDSENYGIAIGTNAGDDIWIGGGYISDYPYTFTLEDISIPKKMLIKRNDNGSMTQADIDYLSTHVHLERTINKSINRLDVVYDNETVYLENNNPVSIRPHLTVTAYYTDGTNEVVSLYKLIWDTFVPGNNTVTVSYGGKVTSVTINAVILDYFLRHITPDNGLGSWGYTGETPEENSGYWLANQDDTDKVSFNISGVNFSAGDVIQFGYRDKVKYAIGTDIVDTSYNRRMWISGGYLNVDTYTLLSEDVSDMKVLYTRALDSTFNITTESVKRNIISAIYREIRG